VSLSSTTGNAGSLSLTAILQSVFTSHLETRATTGAAGSITIDAANNIGVTSGIDTSASGLSGQGGNISLQSGNTLTVDTIRSGGGLGAAYLGAPGNINLTATNSINVGGIYDDSGAAYSPQASFTAPSIAIGQSDDYISDIAGALYLQYPPGAGAAAIAISGSIAGIGGVVIDSGTGAATLGNNCGYTGETDILSGPLYMQGYSLPGSSLVMDHSSSLFPGVTMPGGYVAVNALTVGTEATVNVLLSGTNTYDQVRAAGAADLDGIFNLSVAAVLSPAIGEVFQVMTFASSTGNFATYQGLRLSNCVLDPVYTGTSMLLVTSTIPTGASQPLQSVPPGGLSLSAGAYYDGLGASLQTADGFTASGALLDGTASQATTVSMNLAASGLTNFQLQGNIGGYLLNLLGTGTDKVVVQLDYNETDALAAAGDERQLFLASTDGASPFENAVLANTDLPGESNNPTEIFGAYDPAADFHLGYYGVDTIDNRVWAVVDYDAIFGLGALNVSASPSGPAAATESASGILAISATLNGLVDYNGYCTTVVFESGTSANMEGDTMSPAVASGSAAGFAQVSYPLTGLAPVTTYYYRVDAITTTGTEFGGVLSFTTPESPLNIWREANFGTYSNSGAAADTATPAGDGISNLLKYATGMSPLVPAAGQPAVMGQSDPPEGTYLTLTFNEIADPALTYSVQATDNLGGPWTTIWSSTGADNVAGSMTIEDTVPIGQDPGRFLRLEISH
jgi:hypothetical protein